MKTLILSVLAFGTIYAFSYGPTSRIEMCQSFDFNSKQEKCLNVTKQGHFNSKAMGFCRTHFDFDSKKFECLGKIKDKEYSKEELNFCKKKDFSSHSLKCLDQVGSAYTELPSSRRSGRYQSVSSSYEDSCPTLTSLDRKIEKALKNLDRGNVSRAKLDLNRLKKAVKSCE